MNRFTAFRAIAALFAFFPLGETSLHAQLFQFHFPTANHALFEPGAQDQFFVGTAGKPWTSGCFGCVRSDGGQLHEGLDIRCLSRDMKGEPSDPVFASAAGTSFGTSPITLFKGQTANAGHFLQPTTIAIGQSVMATSCG